MRAAGFSPQAEKTSRDSGLGELEISVTPREPITDELVKAFQDMGVSRLILLQTGRNESELLAYVDQIASSYL